MPMTGPCSSLSAIQAGPSSEHTVALTTPHKPPWDGVREGKMRRDGHSWGFASFLDLPCLLR